MTKQVLVLDGHPHGADGHLCDALAAAYAEGARSAGAGVEVLKVAGVTPPPLSDPADFATPPDEAMLAAQEAVRRADHLAIFFPIWLGTMPAMLKAFLEHLCRDGFAISDTKGGGWPRQNLKGKSARVVTTMGMPALAYRFWFGATGVRCLKSMVLRMSGISPVRTTYIGGVDNLGEAGRARWMEKMKAAARGDL